MQITADIFLNKTTIVYGESRTGKSFLLRDIFFNLKSHIDQAFIVSPTDKSNKEYSSYLFPKQLIHDDITADVLNKLWDRQIEFTGIYKLTQDINNLRAILRKIGDSQESERSEHNMRALLLKYTNKDPSLSYLKERTEQCIVQVYKNAIKKCTNHKNLTRNELLTVHMIDINPRLLIVFDDSTAIYSKISKMEVFKRIFYEGRHNNITMIMTCHSDKSIPTELRRNCFNSIFTSKNSATIYFDKLKDDFNSQIKARNEAAINDIIRDNRKLLWRREEDDLNGVTAVDHGSFSFCSPTVIEYCNKLNAVEEQVDFKLCSWLR